MYRRLNRVSFREGRGAGFSIVGRCGELEKSAGESNRRKQREMIYGKFNTSYDRRGRLRYAPETKRKRLGTRQKCIKEVDQQAGRDQPRSFHGTPVITITEAAT